MSLGYAFKIKNRAFSVGVGYRFNYFTGGVYKEEDHYVQPYNRLDVTDSQTLNPFSHSDFSDTANRRNAGLTFEAGIRLTQKLTLELGYSYNPPIAYGNTFAWEGNYKIFSSDDISLTVKYLIK